MRNAWKKSIKRFTKKLLATSLSTITALTMVANPIYAANAGIPVDSGTIMDPNPLRIVDHPEKKGWSWEVTGNDGYTLTHEADANGGFNDVYEHGYGQIYVELDNEYNPDNEIKVHYNYVGTYRGENIGATLTLSKIRRLLPGPSPLWPAGKPFITISESMFSGFWFINAQECQLDYEFFYEGTNEAIDIEGFVAFNSLNYDAGPWAEKVAYLANPNTKTYVLAQNNINSGIYSSVEYGDIYSYWGASNDFTDYLGGETFGRNSVVLEVYGPKLSFMLGGAVNTWMAPSTSPISIYRPANPVKTVDKPKEYIGNQVVYSLIQDVNTMGVDTLEKYTTMQMVNTMPSEVDYISAKVVDELGNEVPGTLNYDPNTRLLTFDFTSDYLRNVMKYEGESYTWQITTKLNDNAKGKTSFPNISKTVINGVDLVSNTVDVAPLYIIDTSIIHGTISNRIEAVNTGDVKTVNWQAEVGYKVTSVKVDGVDIPIANVSGDSYTFNDVKDSHRVDVICEPAERYLELTKTIDSDDMNWANGTPTFVFKVEGTDMFGTNHTFYRSFEFTKAYVDANATSSSTTVSMTQTINDLVPGTYKVTEMGSIRYDQDGVTYEDDVHKASYDESTKTVTFDLLAASYGKVNITNNHTRYDKLSHTNIVANQISR